MIRKWIEVTCDFQECGASIGHYPSDTIKSAVEFAKEDGAIVRYAVGRRQPYVFCNEECYESWLKENTKDGEERSRAPRMGR